MAFEKKVLALAESVGINDAYFAYGSLFIPLSSISLPGMQEIKRFVSGYSEQFNGRAQVSLCSDEIAVDFVLS